MILCDSKRPLKMAFVPQHDQFFEKLTVRECLWFASKVHAANCDEDDANHEKLVEQMLDKLGLSICADTGDTLA